MLRSSEDKLFRAFFFVQFSMLFGCLELLHVYDEDEQCFCFDAFYVVWLCRCCMGDAWAGSSGFFCGSPMGCKFEDSCALRPTAFI
jgi:hypothetical protein